MAKITEKDIAVFVKVLNELLVIYEKNPKIITKFLTSTTDACDNKFSEINLEINTEAVEGFDLFEIAKALDKIELLNKLNSFNLAELKYIQKKYILGGSQLRTAKSIAEYIADQAKKRTVDVFKDQS